MQDGVIGKIKEVHTWCQKSWGDRAAKPDRTDAVPEHFNWDLWLGVCADRPFIGGEHYHPGNWRKRLDFGTGTLGDMGCHILDPLFEGIGLAAPTAVRSEGPAPNQWNWAVDGKVTYTFAGNSRTAAKTFPLTWHDGASKPPADVIALIEGKDFPESRSILIGTGGAMLLPHCELPTLHPKKSFESLKFPKVQGHNHWAQFVNACRGEDRTTAGFDYAGPLTETVLLGGIASQFPNTTLDWDSRRMKFNVAKANAFIRREYRKGWSVKGLS
jgi:predicted dehydrogenase